MNSRIAHCVGWVRGGARGILSLGAARLICGCLAFAAACAPIQQNIASIEPGPWLIQPEHNRPPITRIAVVTAVTPGSLRVSVPTHRKIGGQRKEMSTLECCFLAPKVALIAVGVVVLAVISPVTLVVLGGLVGLVYYAIQPKVDVLITEEGPRMRTALLQAVTPAFVQDAVGKALPPPNAGGEARVHLLASPATAEPLKTKTAAILAQDTSDAVLILQLDSAILEATSAGSDPRIVLRSVVKATLASVSDGNPVYSRVFTSTGPTWMLSEWTLNDNARLRSELEHVLEVAVVTALADNPLEVRAE